MLKENQTVKTCAGMLASSIALINSLIKNDKDHAAVITGVNYRLWMAYKIEKTEIIDAVNDLISVSKK